MASYYKKLKADLARAASAGIITPEQADKVWESSCGGSTFAGFGAAHWIAAAAGLFISLGIILLVAHNWDAIGAIAKMAAFLLLLAGAGEAAIRLEESPAAAISLETLWFFMPILGIGLYAQIFNLSGDPVKPYLAWAAISAPLAVLSKRRVTAYLTAILLFAVVYLGTLNSSNMMSLAAGYYRQDAQPLWHWLPALLALGAGFALYPAERLYKPLGAGLFWLFLMLVSNTAVRVQSEALVLLAGMSLAVLWLVWGSGDESREHGLPLTLWTAAVYLMTFFWHYQPGSWHGYGRTDTAAGTVLTWAAFLAALAGLALRRQRLLPAGKTEDYTAKGLLAASILCAFLLFGATETSAKLLAAAANLILAAFGAGCIVAGAENSEEKLINRGVLVITLLAVTRFVDIFGGLLRSGLAFIATGLLFAALAYFVNRGRKALISSVKK
jgi:uncharacterized membrane protein